MDDVQTDLQEQGEQETIESSPQANVIQSTPETNVPNSSQSRKRKRTSKVWTQFEMMPALIDNMLRARCRDCGVAYQCDSNNGTTNTKRHMESCVRKKTNDIGQLFMNASQSSLSMRTEKFNIEVFREKIYMAMIRHDLPFNFVEYDGFRDALKYIHEGITLASRNTVNGAILKLYDKEKGIIRKLMHSISGRISITSDLWTSISTDGYILLMAHFVDHNWKLQKRIINFCFMPTPHTGICLAEKMFTLLSEWGIEKKLFSLTLDNASANDVFVSLLKNRLNLKNALLCRGEFFHVRCCAHILNIIVQEGLKVIDGCILKIRENVKYLKGSQQRRQKFRECVMQVSLEAKKGLRQDVPTRWNSAFLMLESAFFYRLAFEQLQLSDSNFTSCPLDYEWTKVEQICNFLGVFYKVTCIFSGSEYPTSNLYFPHVFVVQNTLTKGIIDEDYFVKNMAEEMYVKFSKYWSKYSVILAVAVVLDPRYKIQFVEWCYKILYGDNSPQLKEVREKLNSLFAQYLQNSERVESTSYASTNASFGVTKVVQDSMDNILEDFDNFDEVDIANGSKKSQLELYMDEPRMDRKQKLDVLQFWRGNQYRYPELSLMARDILSIPISTVALEAAFSIGGRVVDKFRSSLKPENIEALMCCRDWLFGKKDDMEPKIEELCEDIITMDENATNGGATTIVGEC